MSRVAHPASAPATMAANAASRNGGVMWLMRVVRPMGKAPLLRGLRIIDEPYAEGMAEHTCNNLGTVYRRRENMYGNA